jgi:hypothetical protein
MTPCGKAGNAEARRSNIGHVIAVRAASTI